MTQQEIQFAQARVRLIEERYSTERGATEAERAEAQRLLQLIDAAKGKNTSRKGRK